MNEQRSLPDIDRLWDRDNPALSETRFREAVKSAKDFSPAYELELLTQLARSIGLQNRFEEAHGLLGEIEKRMTDELKQVRVRYLLERDRVFNSSGQPVRACPLFVQAYEVANEAHLDFYRVDAAHMLGIAEDTAEKRLEWNEKALAAAERSTNPKTKKWAGALYNNMGWTWFDQKRYDKAIELFRRGVAFREQMNQPRELRIAKYAVAKTLHAMGRVPEAINLIKSVCDECTTVGEADGYFDEEMGECLLALNRPAEAQPLFARAHSLLLQDQWLVKNDPERIARLAKLARGNMQN